MSEPRRWWVFWIGSDRANAATHMLEMLNRGLVDVVSRRDGIHRRRMMRPGDWSKFPR